jgi:CelD/BcsL family acetyltransferase involved in cellulose biosynthesis
VFGRVVQFLGSGKVASDYATLLSAPGREDDVAQCVASWLCREGAATWDALELTGVDREDVAVRRLLGALREAGHTAHERAGASCWRVDLPSTWEAYVAMLSKSRRERVRQLGRRQFETGRAITRVVQHADELPAAFAILRDLHGRRRHSLGDAGCFGSPQFAAFLELVAERFLAIGQLRLQWTELEGRPVAAELDFVAGDTMYYYQSGLNPDVIEERPGWLSTMAALRAAIEQGLGTYDFLRGDYAFKANWRGVPRPLMEVRVAPRRSTAQLRQLLWRGRQGLKTGVKRLLEIIHWRRKPEAPHLG